jgi:6-phosphogluconolactonase
VVGDVSGETLIAADREELARLAAELVARAIDEAVRQRGIARLALSGGSTPAPAYRALAQLGLPWASTEWFLVDERAAAPDSDRSNFQMMKAALGFEALGVPAQQVHRMEAERADRAVAAADYERAIRRSFGVAEAASFDAMVLGVGEDGHTASLFPGTGSASIDDRLVAAVEAPGGLEPRLTLTAPVLRAARLVLVLAHGAAKRGPVARARTAGDLEEVPARVLLAAEGRVVWLLDGEAACAGATSPSSA